MADIAPPGAPSRLSRSPINLIALREDARAELEGILADLRDRSDDGGGDGGAGGSGSGSGGAQTILFVDTTLTPALRLVFPRFVRDLRDAGADVVAELGPGKALPAALSSAKAVLFLTRPTPALVKRIAVIVRELTRRSAGAGAAHAVAISVAFAPRRT
jgi:hypothetical protein